MIINIDINDWILFGILLISFVFTIPRVILEWVEWFDEKKKEKRK